MTHYPGAGLGAVFVLIAAVLWGTTGTAATFAPDVGPLAIGAAAMGIGGLLQAALAGPELAHARHELRRRWLTVAAGGLAVAIYPLAFYSSMRLAGVAVGTVVSIGSAPIASAVIERVIDGHRLTRRWVLGAGVGLVGVVLLSFVEPASAAEAGNTTLGILLGLLAGATYALYSWAAHRTMQGGVPSRVAMGAIFGVGGVLLMPVLLVTGAPLLESWTNFRSAPIWRWCRCSWDTCSSVWALPGSRQARRPRCPWRNRWWRRFSPSSLWVSGCPLRGGSASDW